MKLRICVFLIKDNLPDGYDVLEGNPRPIAFSIGETQCEFYWRTSGSRPKWVHLFEGVDGIDVADMTSRGVHGLLKLSRNGRIFCITFGHARHMINPLAIERYFGLKAALGLTDPDLIKSIEKTNIDRTPFRSRSQATKYVSMSDFEFKFDWEILKSITGVVEENDDDGDYEVVSGSDSLFLHTDIDIAGIPALCDRLFEAYSGQGYRQKFPWIDYIVPVRDRAVVGLLDQEVVERINNSDFGSVWVAPPIMIDQEDFYGFSYSMRGKAPVVHSDMALEQCIIEKDLVGTIDASAIKSTRVTLFAAPLFNGWVLLK